MSRTYNSKYDFYKNIKTVVFPNGYHEHVGGRGICGYDIDIEPGGTYKGGDITYTTMGDHDNAHNITVRHPNKKKKTNSLGREFTKNGISGTNYYRNRFGEEDYKSSRCRLVKREQT